MSTTSCILRALRLRSRNNHGALIESTPCQNQESIIMTICLRHDCILTERDERVGVKGHDRVHLLEDNMWIRAHGAWVEQTPDDEYVSFYKQDRTRAAHHRSLPIVSYLKNSSFLCVLSGASDTQRYDYPYASNYIAILVIISTFFSR